jgi:hypothetical protein
VEVTRQEEVVTEARGVVLVIPGSLLGTGEYELTLKGVIGPQNIEEVCHYYFDALKR